MLGIQHLHLQEHLQELMKYFLRNYFKFKKDKNKTENGSELMGRLCNRAGGSSSHTTVYKNWKEDFQVSVEPAYFMSPFGQLQIMLAKLKNMHKHAYIMSSLLVDGGVVPPEIVTNQIRVPIHIQRLWLRISWPTYVILGVFYECLLFCTFAIIISCNIINHHACMQMKCSRTS